MHWFNKKRKEQPRDVVIGATSSLAVVLCHQLAAKGHQLVLVGRNKRELDRLKNDIVIRYGVETSVVQVDFAHEKMDVEKLIAAIFKKTKQVNTIYMLAGDIGDMGYQERPDNVELVTRVNYTNPAKLLAAAAEKMTEQDSGTIVVISSVAGDRGRQSNYIYGSAKAALTAFASGLRNKFFKRKVHVMTVKPGFIDTPMTFGINSPLVASRELVSKSIISAARKKKDVVYVPWRWQVIMTIICHIPEWLFKRLSL